MLDTFSSTTRAGDVPSRAAARFNADWPSGKAADDACAAPDLAQDPLERIVRANAPPVLLGESDSRPTSLDRHSTSSAARVSRCVAQLGSRLGKLFPGGLSTSSAAWIAFSIAATSRIFGRGTWLNTLR